MLLNSSKIVVHKDQSEWMETGVNNGAGREFTDQTAFVCMCGKFCFVKMEVCG